MNDLYKSIGDRIRDLRSRYAGGTGISQEDLAKKMGTTANTISRWESATYKPSAMDLHKLAKIFGVNVSVFFPETEMPKLAALTSALGELKEEDLDDVAEYALFRRARQQLKEAKEAKKRKKK
jgi:transcriptional regulator with XRE-family HTH domain